ncbi:hypothetical protein [Lacrimispora amygdalina]|uniref:hypothetical protein n=1 Tax=Lacrimispora amygdalina TaxID=253257 RepID=UPI000BE406B1|nr:hypothetical protein [Lacrimispora amygdalina]
MSSDLGSLVSDATAIADCNSIFKNFGVSILRWDANTQNTPYKQGLYVNTNQGFIIDFPIASTYKHKLQLEEELIQSQLVLGMPVLGIIGLCWQI